MPFIQRIIEPVFLSRPTQQSTREESTNQITNETKQNIQYDDFHSVANSTLANVLRQLGSVVLIADEILCDLGNELQAIRNRSDNIQKRIIGVEKSLENIDSTIICKCFCCYFSLKTTRMQC